MYEVKLGCCGDYYLSKMVKMFFYGKDYMMMLVVMVIGLRD